MNKEWRTLLSKCYQATFLTIKKERNKKGAFRNKKKGNQPKHSDNINVMKIITLIWRCWVDGKGSHPPEAQFVSMAINAGSLSSSTISSLTSFVWFSDVRNPFYFMRKKFRNEICARQRCHCHIMIQFEDRKCSRLGFNPNEQLKSIAEVSCSKTFWNLKMNQLTLNILPIISTFPSLVHLNIGEYVACVDNTVSSTSSNPTQPVIATQASDSSARWPM